MDDAIVHGACVVLFLLLGILFSCGKGAFLIAGYNTAPREEKAGMDEKALCRFMGTLMFLLAACWLIVLASAVFDRQYLFWIGFGAFLIVLFGGIVYANTGNRFKK